MDVSLRGFQVSPVIGVPQGVTVYVDGVRANEPDAHEVNFDLLPLEDVERVEVVYGPSVLLGRNALGAVVNLVTRRGASPAARGIEASAGSWGRYELKARAGARHGVWDYYVGARYEGGQARADGVGAVVGETVAMVAEHVVVPYLHEGTPEHVAADQVEARGDVAVGEDVGADPGAARRLAVGEDRRVRVKSPHLLAAQLGVEH